MMMPNGMGMPSFMGGMGGMGQSGGMPFQLISGAPQGSSAGFFPLSQNNQK